jgi:PadR family transcriptional regulator PadR
MGDEPNQSAPALQKDFFDRVKEQPGSDSPVDIPQVVEGYSCGDTTGVQMAQGRSEILQGTLDLMVLKTLEAMGPLHGFGLARRIEQISEDALRINQGTIYASLVRLLQKGWISGVWGTSDNNRRARFYSITRAGRKQLRSEAENWERIAGVVGRVLRVAERG